MLFFPLPDAMSVKTIFELWLNTENKLLWKKKLSMLGGEGKFSVQRLIQIKF
jgi:hypothetical protein